MQLNVIMNYKGKEYKKLNMSGHNPHGHLSQPPNSSWNPLQFQVPSYIPRQPQLAHMSNERQLPRSPLTWHTPAPPDALYSFISANHKNLELNPLLPSFVRGPPPFGSMDLTIQSARNTTTPSPRSLTSPPPEFCHNKQLPRSLTPNSLVNTNIAPSASVIQSTASVREKFQNSNGNNGDLMSPGSIFIRDARQINNDLVKMVARDALEMVPQTSEPVELVKDVTYQATKSHIVPTSPRRLSPTVPSATSGNSIPDTPQSPSPTSPLPDTSTTNNVQTVTEAQAQEPDVTEIRSPVEQLVAPVNRVAENLPSVTTVPSPPSNSVSNEDSLDSSSSKTRRKGKPSKIRLSDETDEDSIPQRETNSISEVPINNVDCLVEPSFSSSKEEVANEEPVVTEINKIKETELISEAEPEQISSVIDDIGAEVNKSSEESSPELRICSENNSTSTENGENCQEKEDQDVIVNNDANSEQICPLSDKSNIAISPLPKENSYIDEEKEACDKFDDDNTSCFDSPRKRLKRKGDSDDIETIDKIAAMIAGTEEVAVENVGNNNTETDVQNGKSEAQNSTSKINELTEILETSFCNEEQRVDEKALETVKENSFEEVENKLEEMFAGIEDERPPPNLSTNSDSTTNDRSCNEVVSDLSLGNQLDVKAEDILFDDQKPSTSSSSIEKRVHASKHDRLPPKKKRKIVKKPIPAPKTCSKQKTKNLKQGKHEKSTVKEKVKDETSQDSKYKGPFLIIKTDGSVNVVNTPLNDDDLEKQSKVKKAFHNHNKSDRNKIRGLHVSTLSMKYDADTTDATWMCVFCKRGPHKLGLGDLFGPYFITTTCEEFEITQGNLPDDEFISKRKKSEMYQKHPNGMPVMPSSSTLLASSLASTSNVKKKRKTNDSPANMKTNNGDSIDIFMGMTKATDTSYEVWLHEDCAVWAPGVHIVGATIVGLEVAIWSSTRHKCSYCSDNGANVCCLYRGCSVKAHISCARMRNWTLDEIYFKSYCEAHSLLTS